MNPLSTVFGLLGSILALALPVSAVGAELVTDESFKIQMLREAFPGSAVSVSRAKPLDWSPSPWPGHPLTDALAGEREYHVVGAPDAFEPGWASGIDGKDIAESHSRRVRFRAYKLNSSRPSFDAYVALAHYTFTGIRAHPFCCEWFARIFVLVQRGSVWVAHPTDESLTYRGKTIRSFRAVDLGDGSEKLLIEAENTAAGYRRWITLTVFGVMIGRPVKLGEIDTLSTNDNIHTQYSREVNWQKTRLSGRRALYLDTTEYGDELEQFPTPRHKEDILNLSAP